MSFLNKLFALSDKFFTHKKGFRRLLICWACWLLTVYTLRITDAAIIGDVSPWAATFGATLAGLVTFFGWQYGKHRNEEKNVNTD